MKMNKEEKRGSRNDVEVEIGKETTLKIQEQGTVVLEDALKLTGVGRYNYILFALSIYSLMSAALEIFGVTVLKTAAQCDLELDLYKRGLIGSLPMLGVMLSGHLWGYVADTRGRKFTLCITMGGTFLLATISSFANHWIFMAFTKFLSAMFASGTNAVICTLLGESTPQSHRASFLLYAATGTMSSQLLISVVAFPILKATFSLPTFMGFNYRPWRLLAQTYGLLNGFSLMVLLLYIYESPKFHLSRGEEKEGLDILIKIFRRNTGKDKESYSVKHVVLDEEAASKQERNFFKSIWAQTVPLLSKQHIRNTMLMFYTSIVVYSVGPPLVIWYPEIFNSFTNNMDRVNELTFCEIIEKRNQTQLEPTAELTTTCDDRVNDVTLGIMIASGSYLLTVTGSLALVVKLLGKKWTFIGVHIICALAAILLNNFTGLSGAVFLVIMNANATCMGITTTYVVELFPTYMRAMAVCLTMMVGRTFSFIVINSIGPLVNSNCTVLFYGFGIFLLSVMSSGHLWGYVADTRGRKFTLCITMRGTFLIATTISSLANHWIFFITFTKFLSAMLRA